MEVPPRDLSKARHRLSGHVVPSRGITSATISSKAKISSRRSLSVNVPGPSQHRAREIPPPGNAYSRSRITVDESSKSARRASSVLSGSLSRSTATVTESRKDVEKEKATTWSALSASLPSLDFSPTSSSPPSSQLESHATELYLLLSTLQLRLAAHDVSTSVQEMIREAEAEIAKLETAVGVNIQDEQTENKHVLWGALTERKFAHRFIPLLHELSILSLSADEFLDTPPREFEDGDENGLLTRSETLQNSLKKIQANIEGLTSSSALAGRNPSVLRNLLELYTQSITGKIERLKCFDDGIRRKRFERRQIVWEKSLEISRMG